MPRIYKPSSGLSVELQAAQRVSDPGPIQAPNLVNQVESLGRQSQAYLQSYQDQTQRNAQFEQTTLARAQRAQESNAQLALQQLQTQQSFQLKASEIQNNLAQVGLDNQRLTNEQQSQANQISLEQKRIQSQQLTELGNSFLKFSETLWRKKAEQINEENEQLRLRALNDYLADPSKFGPDVARVNQAEILRTQGTIKAETAAQNLEQQGQKAAATQVRSANPFYLRGVEEGRAMKAGLNYPVYLQSKVRQALDNGDINVLDPLFQQKLTQIIGIASNEFIKEQGLAAVNPAVLAKYFGYTKSQAEAQILESYSNQAYKSVKEAQKETADSTVYNSAAAILKMPRDQWDGELIKLAAITTSAYSMDPIKGHQSMLQQLIKQADIAQDFSLVDAFVNADRGDGKPFGSSPGLQETYDKAKALFTQRQAAILEKQVKSSVDAVVGQFDAAFATGDVPQIRAAQEQAVSQLMAIGTPEATAAARRIASTNAGESPLIQNALRDAQNRGYLDQFLRQNRDRMSAATYEKYAKIADNSSRLKRPEYQQELNRVLSSIQFASGEANMERDKLLPGYAKRAVNDYVKLQQDKLRQYSREWLAQNPNSNLKDFQDWLKGQEKSYTDPKQFIVDPQTYLPKGMQSMGGGTEFTGNPNVLRVSFGGRMREDYRNPKVQEGLANGSVSAKAIQPNVDVVLSQQQIAEAVSLYEKDRSAVGWIQKIATRSGFTYKSFLQAQARVHGGSGVIVEPGNFQLPRNSVGRVSFDAVRDYGKTYGMSDRGAIAFATMVHDESGGNPANTNKIGATGLMQWLGVRSQRLQQYAAQKGKPVTSPELQLEFAIQELKSYPSIWSVLTSRNPTNNQLWRATKDYLRFESTVDAQRRASLEANLR